MELMSHGEFVLDTVVYHTCIPVNVCGGPHHGAWWHLQAVRYYTMLGKIMETNGILFIR